MSKRDRYPTSILLTPELREALARRAEADGRGLANYIFNLLREHVEDTPEPKRKKIAATR